MLLKSINFTPQLVGDVMDVIFYGEKFSRRAVSK